MGKLLKTVGFAMCRIGGTPAGVPVLAFHSVDDSGAYISTSVEHFRAEMGRLAERGLRGCTIAETVALYRGGPAPKGIVALTFDDGLASFGQNAWPVLREFGHKATLYVPTDYTGGTAGWFPQCGLPPMRSHTWDELRALRDEGADIQSHGCSHPKLPRVDAAAVREEVARSREVLEHELGVEITHFCYPYGEYDERVIQALRESGYVSAVTTRPGRWRPGGDILRIPRDCLDEINVHDPGYSRRVIDACLDGSYSRYIFARNRLRAAVGMSWKPPRDAVPREGAT